MRPACPSCGYIHCSSDVVALSRFAGITGYRAGGEIYATREEAELGLCEQRSRGTA